VARSSWAAGVSISVEVDITISVSSFLASELYEIGRLSPHRISLSHKGRGE
jgi:hypothetical protein